VKGPEVEMFKPQASACDPFTSFAPNPSDPFTSALRAHAGGGATDCGVSERLEDPSSLDECAVTAFENGMPFVARYVLQGTDSEVELGVAGDDAGSVVFLLWDSDPSGGSGEGATIYGDVCHGPTVDSSPDADPVAPPFTCAGMDLLGRLCG